MSDDVAGTAQGARQGGGPERLPMLSMDSLTDRQRSVAQALIDGPRKAVLGPFIPLLRTPGLLEKVAALGEALRFEGTLAPDVRELATCMAAAHVGNQFEWVMHAPLALAAGVPASALESVRLGQTPEELPETLRAVAKFCSALLQRHEVTDAEFSAIESTLGAGGLVELTTLLGYFVTVSWVMNVARTPSRPTGGVLPLPERKIQA